MFNSNSESGWLGIAVVLGTGLSLAGCQAGGALGALDLRGDRAESQQETVSVEELRAFCPPITLREGTAFFRTYERGGDGDPSRIIHQASISDVTRSCSYNGDAITMNVAVAGRIVPGPRGGTGGVTMPIRVAVVRGTEVLYTQLHRYQVEISDTAGATQFVFNDPNVNFILPADRGVRVFAGYDEGPYN